MAETPVRQPLLHNAYKRFTPVIKSKKTASYFTLTLSLISLSFFGLFAIRPTLITATSLLRSVSDLKKLNTEYENKISSIIKAQGQYEQIRDDLHLLNDALPPNATFGKLAKNIEKFAQNSNITLTQLTIDTVPVSTPSGSGKMHDFGFTLASKGDYPSLMSFLTHLLHWRRIVSINSLQFSQEESSPGGNLRLSLKATTYYEP